jgi:hypothetical protein
VTRKEWRKPEVKHIRAGSAEKAPTNNHTDSGVNKS